MAENLVNNQICENCGAEVRSNAAFCYNCGSQVVPDEMVDLVNEGKVSNAWFKESITEEKNSPIQKTEPIRKPVEPLQEKKIVDKSGVELTPLAVGEQPKVKAEKPVADEAEVKQEVVETKTENKENKPLKTAASMRQKPKFAPNQKVEVMWEAPESAPNIWFLLVALVLLIIAVSLVFAMLYIR